MHSRTSCPIHAAGVFILIALVFTGFNSAPGADEMGPRVVAQGEDGTVALHARWVTIHGSTVRYEPQPDKDTIGYWTRLQDWVSWEFEVTKPGRFKVEILQGCGVGSGGSEVHFECSGQVLKVTVEETGGFQKFKQRDIGRITIDNPGKYTISAKPQTKPGPAVMDLRQITLTPVVD